MMQINADRLFFVYNPSRPDQIPTERIYNGMATS